MFSLLSAQVPAKSLSQWISDWQLGVACAIISHWIAAVNLDAPVHVDIHGKNKRCCYFFNRSDKIILSAQVVDEMMAALRESEG